MVDVAKKDGGEGLCVEGEGVVHEQKPFNDRPIQFGDTLVCDAGGAVVDKPREQQHENHSHIVNNRYHPHN
jgi:hypothetical protein